MRFGVKERIKNLFDGGEFSGIKYRVPPHDPLKFKDNKRYFD